MRSTRIAEAMVEKKNHETATSVQEHDTDETQGLHTQNSLSFDILSIEETIRIIAESKATEAFDAEMASKKGNTLFRKIGGFLKRGLQRMGRDAWIGSTKRAIIEEIKMKLKTGEYSETSLREQVQNGDTSIMDRSYLAHEQGETDVSTPAPIQTIVNEWISLDTDSLERLQKVEELKTAIENTYPAITADLSQLESSLLRLEKAKISSELDIVDMKLNFFEIGRIENGNGKRKENFFVRKSDEIAQKLETSNLSPWMKEKLIGTIRHPNTAAVLAALGTRAGVGTLAGATAVGIGGGFFAPLIAGSVAGGFFSGIRAKREMRDRTAQIDRRGATGYNTGSREYDGESSHIGHQTGLYQHPAMDIYNSLQEYKHDNENPEIQKTALGQAIHYLVKHLVGRQTSLNMLQYDADRSVSSQHTAIIRLINQLFPGLVADFNSGKLLAESTDSEESMITKDAYSHISSLAHDAMRVRKEEENKYALKQGAIFGSVAGVVGATVGGIFHSLFDGSVGGHDKITPGTPGTSSTTYAGGLTPHTDHVAHWYNNGTNRIDGTELMTHNPNGSWDVSAMLGKTATINHGQSIHIDSSSFTSGQIQAVLIPTKGGPTFHLPIDGSGKIQIPTELKDMMNGKEFYRLHIGQIASSGDTFDSISTVIGKGNFDINTLIHTTTSPGIPESKVWIPGESNWGYGVLPLGANRYHELGKEMNRTPVEQFQSEDSDDKEISSNDDQPLPASPEDEKVKLPPGTSMSPENPDDTAVNYPVGPYLGNTKTETPSDDYDHKQEKENLDDLWGHIVQIRKDLEGRKNGGKSLSEAAVANMEDTLKKLLEEYHQRRKIWNTYEMGNIGTELERKNIVEKNLGTPDIKQIEYRHHETEDIASISIEEILKNPQIGNMINLGEGGKWKYVGKANHYGWQKSQPNGQFHENPMIGTQLHHGDMIRLVKKTQVQDIIDNDIHAEQMKLGDPLRERIKINFDFYQKTGDRNYLRWNQEILRDIEKKEGKEKNSLSIDDTGKVV